MANTLQNIHIHPRKHPTYIPQGVGADSSRPYPYITKYTYSHHRTRMFKSPHRTIAIDLLTIRKLKKWLSATIKGENVARNVKKIKKIKILQPTFCHSKEYY